MAGVGISAEEARALSDMYWAEEMEYNIGIHPTQVKERIERCLEESNLQYNEITFLDWQPEGPRVHVSIDGNKFGIFNYETNRFEDVNPRGGVVNA